MKVQLYDRKNGEIDLGLVIETQQEIDTIAYWLIQPAPTRDESDRASVHVLIMGSVKGDPQALFEATIRLGGGD